MKPTRTISPSATKVSLGTSCLKASNVPYGASSASRRTMTDIASHKTAMLVISPTWLSLVAPKHDQKGFLTQ